MPIQPTSATNTAEGSSTLSTLQGCFREGAFMGLKGQKALLHRLCCDQVIHEYGAVLSQAMGSIGGLVFDGRIPPGIEEEDMIGGSEVEAEPTGAQGYEHHWWP